MQMLLATLGAPPTHFLSVIVNLVRNVRDLNSLIFQILREKIQNFHYANV